MAELEQVPPEAKRVGVAVIAGLIAPILDTTIVTIAFEQLTSALSTTVETVQWTNTGYLLALAVAVSLAGWAARRFGSRTAWRTGLIVFLIGSIASAAAWNVQALIAFRTLQGIGAGLLFPLMTSILVSASGGQALGRLVAMVSLPTALGPICGPVIGGLILHWLDWRWLFLVNVPVCAVALYLSSRIPDDRVVGDRSPLDVVGLALLAPGLVGVLLGLSNAHEGIGRATVLVPLAIGVVLLVVFVLRGVRRGDRPVLFDVRVIVRRSVASSSAGLFFFGLATFGVMLALPLYLQQLRGDSVLQAALTLIPQGVGALLTRSLSGRLTDAMGARWVAFGGFLVVAAATIPFALADAATPLWWLTVVLFVRGLGLGTLLSPVMAAGFVGLPGHYRQDASVITRTFQQLGGSFGTAIVAVVLAGAATGVDGFHQAFWWTIGLTLVGALVALALPSSEPAPTSTVRLNETSVDA